MRVRPCRAGLAALALALMLAGCAPLPPESPPAVARGAPDDFPEAHYREALARGKPVFRVDPVGSLAVIEVRRGGSLARLGHDHVVASHEVEGYLAPEEGRADLYVLLGRLAVDEPALRAEAGFDTQPARSDIEGTRANMLQKVLEAEKFPYAFIRVRDVDANQRDATLAVEITLHGVTRTLQVPIRIDADAGGISVTGKFSFDQTDFGITPYSLLGGAIAVGNRVALRFRIRASRLSGAG